MVLLLFELYDDHRVLQRFPTRRASEPRFWIHHRPTARHKNKQASNTTQQRHNNNKHNGTRLLGWADRRSPGTVVQQPQEWEFTRRYFQRASVRLTIPVSVCARIAILALSSPDGAAQEQASKQHNNNNNNNNNNTAASNITGHNFPGGRTVALSAWLYSRSEESRVGEECRLRW
mgnify:CR=1 FL=1